MRVLAIAGTAPDLDQPIAQFVTTERIDVVVTAIHAAVRSDGPVP